MSTAEFFKPQYVIEDVDVFYSMDPYDDLTESIPSEIPEETVIALTERLESFAQITGAIVLTNASPKSTTASILHTSPELTNRINNNPDVFVGPYAPKAVNGKGRRVLPHAIGIWQLKASNEV